MGKIQLLVTDEPNEFEKWPVQVEEFLDKLLTISEEFVEFTLNR